MKKLAIFLLSVSLLIPTGAHACWDEDWDDYEDTGSWDDDDWYDDYFYDDLYDDLFGDDWLDDDDDNSGYGDDVYDGGWLDDVVVTPDNNNDEDYDWGLDEDWWRTKDSDDDDYSDNSDDVQGWGDDDDDTGSSSQTGGKSNNNNNKDKTDDKDKDKDKPLDYDPQRHDVTDKDITVDNLPDKGIHQQTGKYDCVATCMQYLSDILLDEGIINKKQIEDEYKDKYGSSKTGIDAENLKDFVSSIYNTHEVNTYDDYREAIDNGDPVMATVNGIEENIHHEIVVVGYPEEDEDEEKEDDERPLIVYDPATGSYQETPFGSIHDGSGMAIEDINQKP